MNKKIVITTMITIFILLGAATASSTTLSVQQANRKSTFADNEISLGTATVYGDGIEGNTVADAVTEKNLIIQLISSQETADLFITYSIRCDGALDEGRVYLFVQLNGDSIGNESVDTAENEEGTIGFYDVLLKKGDVLTWEIGVLYSNFDPLFSKADLDVGASVIISKSRTTHSRLFDSPLFQLLLRLPVFTRLLAL